MLSQDSQSHPCVIYGKAHFRGAVLRSAMEKALEQMLQQHPLLQARIATGAGPASWELSSATACPVTWSDSLPPDEWAENRFVDLQKESGLRVHIHCYSDTENQPQCVMFLGVHHACTDGLGLLNAFEDLCLLYQAILSKQATELRNRYNSDLAERNRFGLNARKIIRLLPKHAVGLLGLRQFLMRKPVPLVPSTQNNAEQADRSAITAITHKFDCRTTNAIQFMATRREVTVNDLLACSIFQGLARFRNELHVQQPDDWLRMMVPVNMRANSNDFRQSACNIVSSVFLDRTPSQILDGVGLLRSIHDEMELIKRNRLALIFSYSLWFRSKLYRGRPKPTSSTKCQTTLVFTNLGKPFRKSEALNTKRQLTAGDMTLESIELLAPLAPLVAVAFSAINYAQSLYLSLRYDQRVVDKHSAEELLATVCSQLQTWLDNEAAQA